MSSELLSPRPMRMAAPWSRAREPVSEPRADPSAPGAYDDTRALIESLRAARPSDAERMAHALHDGLAQMLTLALIQLDAARDPRHPDVPGAIANSRALVKDALRAARQAIRDLQQVREPVPDLSWALLSAATRLGQLSGRTIYLDCDAQAPTPPDEVSTALVDAARELMLNACKHAPNAQIFLTLAPHGEGLQLTVQDNGPGFDPSRLPGASADHGGYGLTSMSSWLSAAGVQFSLHTAIGQGVSATLRWQPGRDGVAGTVRA